jgi:hypothetical protein
VKFKPIFVALLLLAPAGPALADNARLPYHLVYTIQKAQANINDAHTNLLLALTMQSTSPEIKTADLSVYIDAKAGKIPVEMGPGGDFAVPLRDDLLAENPWIVVNQPKGTMKLNWQAAVLPGKFTHSIRYARLMRPVRDSGDVEEQMRRYFPGSPERTVTGLNLTFPSTDQNPTVVIHTKNGDRKLEASPQGTIFLPLISDLIDEDPEITLTATPLTMQIFFRQNGE